MPLRDHFRPPLDDYASWGGFHGMWPAIIVQALNRTLPPQYAAEPRVQLGSTFEIDVAALEGDRPRPAAAEGGAATATAAWAPPRPTLDVAADLPGQDVYEVRVFEGRRRHRLVAAVEIVSPANKDRPEHRRAFVAKCAALLQQGVSVSVVDLVTTRQFNLYADLLALIVGDSNGPAASPPPPLYAAACRWRRDAPPAAPSDIGPAGGWHFQAWSHTLTVGQPLPTLPLWLTDDVAVPLELEATYEETYRTLRLP